MTEPIWLLFPPDAPFEGLRSAGVAITPTTLGNWHAGILHQGKGSPVRLLHLAWDHDLQNVPPKPHYAWIQLALPRARLLSVAAMCRRIAKVYALRGRGLPYAFRFKDAAFRDNGRLLLGESEHGLTCSTFVLAVLSSVRINLLRLSEWPSRPADVARHEELLDLLDGDPRVSRDHVAAVRAEVTCVRYRPEEVAGAAASPEPPVSFLVAQAAAEHITRTFARRAMPLTEEADPDA